MFDAIDRSAWKTDFILRKVRPFSIEEFAPTDSRAIDKAGVVRLVPRDRRARSRGVTPSFFTEPDCWQPFHFSDSFLEGHRRHVISIELAGLGETIRRSQNTLDHQWSIARYRDVDGGIDGLLSRSFLRRFNYEVRSVEGEF